VGSGLSLTNATVDFWPASNPNAVTTLVTGASGGSGAALATFDTTTLPNGSYVIRLRASGSGGSSLSSGSLVTVVGENKPGRITFDITDLTVPVTGLPITIGRTYDSLERSISSDFGFGWHLSVGHPRIETDPAHNVTLTLPGGKRASFAFTPRSVGGIFGFLLTPAFTPEAGVQLDAGDSIKGRILRGNAEMVTVETAWQPALEVPIVHLHACFSTAASRKSKRSMISNSRDPPMLSPDVLIQPSSSDSDGRSHRATRVLASC